MPSKSEFVRILQDKTIGLAPYDISQHLREYAGCVSVYEADPQLRIEDYRGYMVRPSPKATRSPEDPELYVCVVSLQQPKQWQDLVWAKEILGVLDAPEHRTNDRAKFGAMIDHRKMSSIPDAAKHPNVAADLNGLTLALGSMIPAGYRQILRDKDFLGRYSIEILEGMLGIPAEHIPIVLGQDFEDKFNVTIDGCDA